jgi:hypothetical protein
LSCRVEEAEVEVVEFGSADHPAVAQLEFIEMRAVPAGERGVDRVGELAEPMGAAGGEDPPRPRPIVPAATADQIDLDRQPRSCHD